jgi:hypothetical protein
MKSANNDCGDDSRHPLREVQCEATLNNADQNGKPEHATRPESVGRNTRSLEVERTESSGAAGTLRKPHSGCAVVSSRFPSTAFRGQTVAMPAAHAESLIRRMLELEHSGVPYNEFMASLPYYDLVVLSDELRRRLSDGEDLPVAPAVCAGAEGAD